MSDSQKQLRKFGIIALILLLITVIAWFTYDAIVFRVKGTTPKNGAVVSNVIPRVEFVFNKPLKDDQIADRMIVLVNGENPTELIRESVTVVDNRVVVELAELRLDTDYSFKISDITSTDGKRISEASLRFRTKFVPYNRLSSEEKQTSIEDVKDPDTAEDPIYGVTPYQSSEYTINFELRQPGEENPYGETPAEQKVIIINISMSNADYRSNTKAIIKERKTRALNYLKSKGIAINSYTVEFTQDPYVGATP